MTFHQVEVSDEAEKSRICRMILTSLPYWFGIQESIDDYCKGVKRHSFLKVSDETKIIGFVSIKINSEYAAELYVLGLLPEYHRKGIGTSLVQDIEADLKKRGFRYLEVKTLDESRESDEYRRTRLFYRKCGFLPIDTLYQEWGMENPCLIMIKSL